MFHNVPFIADWQLIRSQFTMSATSGQSIAQDEFETAQL
jgi:hypothetical protein